MKLVKALLENKKSTLRTLHLSDNKLSADVAHKFAELINDSTGS